MFIWNLWHCFKFFLIIKSIKMENEGKRPRAPNYSQREKDLLLNLVMEFKSVVENKKTDGVSVQEKKEAWKQIQQKFNVVSPELTCRTVESLKKFYEKMKEDLRKRCGEQKKQIYTTGGGPSQKIVDGNDDLLLSIIKEKSVFGLDSPFDSDSQEKVVTEEDIVNQDMIMCNTESNGEIMTMVQREKQQSSSSKIEFEFIEESDKDKAENIVLQNQKQPTKFKISGRAEKENWAKASPGDLCRPLNSNLKRNLKEMNAGRTTSRRRPAVVSLSSSRLGEKYEELVDKKIELLNCYKKEHELRMESLKLDIAMKKKQISTPLNRSVDTANPNPLLNEYSI